MHSSTNEKSVCGGCLHCGSPSQINECVGNTGDVAKLFFSS